MSEKPESGLFKAMFPSWYAYQETLLAVRRYNEALRKIKPVRLLRGGKRNV